MRSRHLAATSLALASLASVVLVVVPLGSYESAEVRVRPDGTQTTVVERGRTTLLEEEDSLVLAFLAIPVAVAALPVLLSRTRIARVARVLAALLLFGLVWLGALSIGIFYAPSAIAMLVAALLRS